MSRVDRITSKSKITEYYSDFLINLDRNPISEELARVTNEKAIIRAIKNLILTNRGERFFNSTLGCGIKRRLFEPIDDVTSDLIKGDIETTIAEHEPRVQLMLVEVLPDEERNLYNVTITFAMKNAPSDVLSFSTVLKRVR